MGLHLCYENIVCTSPSSKHHGIVTQGLNTWTKAYLLTWGPENLAVLSDCRFRMQPVGV